MPTKDGMISFVTGKGAVEVAVPCPEPPARILDAQPDHAAHLFSGSDGSPWSEGGFHASWRRVRLRLEKEGKVKPGLTPHGLRDSVATDLRELGKTAREIADIRACRHRRGRGLKRGGMRLAQPGGAAMAEAHMSALAVILHAWHLRRIRRAMREFRESVEAYERAHGRPPFTPAESA